MPNEEAELIDFTKPKRNFKVFWSVLITIIVLGGAGGYGYYYLNNQYKSQEGDLSNKVSALQKQVDELAGAETTDELDGLSDEPLDTNVSTKEYASSKLGITLRYPKEFFAEEIGSGENVYLIIDKKKIDSTLPAESEFPQQYFMISRFGELCGLSSVKSNAVGKKISDVKIAGVDGWKFTLTKPSDLDGSYSTNYYFNSQSDCYHISVENSDAKGTHDKQVDEIISSISFTK